MPLPFCAPSACLTLPHSDVMLEMQQLYVFVPDSANRLRVARATVAQPSRATPPPLI